MNFFDHPSISQIPTFILRAVRKFPLFLDWWLYNTQRFFSVLATYLDRKIMLGVKTKDAFKVVVASNNVHEKKISNFFFMEFFLIVKNHTIQQSSFCTLICMNLICWNQICMNSNCMNLICVNSICMNLICTITICMNSICTNFICTILICTILICMNLICMNLICFDLIYWNIILMNSICTILKYNS